MWKDGEYLPLLTECFVASLYVRVHGQLVRRTCLAGNDERTCNASPTSCAMPRSHWVLPLLAFVGSGPNRLLSRNRNGVSLTRGGRRHRTLYADSPPLPPPPSLEIGWKVTDHGRRRRPKEILPDLVQGEKMGFHPMCLYSKCSVFGGEPNNG